MYSRLKTIKASAGAVISLAGLAAVVMVLVLGGTGALAMWVSAAAVLLVWWGERAAFSARWDDSGRDHHSRS